MKPCALWYDKKIIWIFIVFKKRLVDKKILIVKFAGIFAVQNITIDAVHLINIH